MNASIAVLPGDGVGPEVIREAVKVLRAVGDVRGHRFDFAEYRVQDRPARSWVPAVLDTLWALLQDNATASFPC